MERIYDKKKISSCIAKSKYHAVLSSLDIDSYLIKYEKGEFVSSPFEKECLFQIVEQGSLNNIYAEAAESLSCISFSIEKHREALLSNNKFLELICRSLSSKIAVMTTIDAAPASLAERVISYMRYKCDNQTLKGIEQAAFHLHCSARQLQRILNQCETAGFVKKLGKGTYVLT